MKVSNNNIIVLLMFRELPTRRLLSSYSLCILSKKPTHDSTAHLLKNRLNSLKIRRVGRISDAHTCANVTAVHTLSPSHTTSVDSENELSYDSARKQNRKYMLYNR